MPFSYPPETRAAAVALVRSGLAPAAVADQLGTSWTAVYGWLHRDAPELVGRHRGSSCFRCQDQPAAPPSSADYLHLLGLYLGDGWLARQQQSWSLSIACAGDYPGLQAEARRPVEAVSSRPTGLVRRRGCSDVKAYWLHWPCVLPQHGTGRKHHRPIHLHEWQWDLAVAQPGPLLRGLFHSDGWRGMNVAVRTVDGVRSERRYSRYQFSNRSDDIRHICAAALDLLDIPWRRSGPWTIAVSRREAVAALDQHVGPKY